MHYFSVEKPSFWLGQFRVTCPFVQTSAKLQCIVAHEHHSICIFLCDTSSLLVDTIAFQKETEIICPYQTDIRYNHIACSSRILPVSEYD